MAGLDFPVDEMYADGYQKEEIKVILGDNLKDFYYNTYVTPKQ